MIGDVACHYILVLATLDNGCNLKFIMKLNES